jgi:hypothetical protein
VARAKSTAVQSDNDERERRTLGTYHAVHMRFEHLARTMPETFAFEPGAVQD